jgi:hypothetical protein
LKLPRIVPVPHSQWTDNQRELVAKYAPNGRADNGLKTLLNLPELVDAVMPYTNYLLNESSLPPRHRALLVLRVAWLLGNQPLCGWCWFATERLRPILPSGLTIRVKTPEKEHAVTRSRREKSE